jgi:hypothetical protein
MCLALFKILINRDREPYHIGVDFVGSGNEGNE